MPQGVGVRVLSWAQTMNIQDQNFKKYILNPYETDRSLGEDSTRVNLTKEQLDEIHESWDNFLVAKETQVETKAVFEAKTVEIGGEREIVFNNSREVKVEQVEVVEPIQAEFSAEPAQEINVLGLATEIIQESFEKIVTAKSVKESVDAFKTGANTLIDVFLYIVTGDYQYLKKEGILTEQNEKSEQPQLKAEKNTSSFEPFAWFGRGVRSIGENLILRLQRNDINSRIKMGNQSFEGVMNDSGQLRVDVQIAAERANSEMSKEEIKKKKQIQMAAVSGKSLRFNLNAQEGNSQVANQIMGAG